MEWVWSAMWSQPMRAKGPAPLCAELWWPASCRRTRGSDGEAGHQLLSSPPRLQQEEGHCWIMTDKPWCYSVVKPVCPSRHWFPTYSYQPLYSSHVRNNPLLWFVPFSFSIHCISVCLFPSSEKTKVLLMANLGSPTRSPIISVSAHLCSGLEEEECFSCIDIRLFNSAPLCSEACPVCPEHVT